MQGICAIKVKSPIQVVEVQGLARHGHGVSRRVASVVRTVRGAGIGRVIREAIEIDQVVNGEICMVGAVQAKAQVHVVSSTFIGRSPGEPNVHCWEHISAECDALGCLISRAGLLSGNRGGGVATPLSKSTEDSEGEVVRSGVLKGSKCCGGLAKVLVVLEVG